MDQTPQLNLNNQAFHLKMEDTKNIGETQSQRNVKARFGNTQSLFQHNHEDSSMQSNLKDQLDSQLEIEKNSDSSSDEHDQAPKIFKSNQKIQGTLSRQITQQAKPKTTQNEQLQGGRAPPRAQSLFVTDQQMPEEGIQNPGKSLFQEKSSLQLQNINSRSNTQEVLKGSTMMGLVQDKLEREVSNEQKKIKKSETRMLFERKNYVAGFREAFMKKIQKDMALRQNKFQRGASYDNGDYGSSQNVAQNQNYPSYMGPLQNLMKQKLAKDYRKQRKQQARNELTRSLYENSYEEQKHQVYFNQLYSKKYKKLKCSLKDQLRTQLDYSSQIKKYHSDQKNVMQLKDNSSLGTVSSADERDMELLFSGEHTYYFQSLELIKQYEIAQKKNNSKRNQLQLDQSKISNLVKTVKDKVKNLTIQARQTCTCKKKPKKNWLNQLQKVKGQSKQIDLAQFQGALKELKKLNQRPKRSGKELWKIAKRLIKKKNTGNVAQNVLKLSRDMKENKKIQEENKLNEYKIQKTKKKAIRFSMFLDDDESMEQSLILQYVQKIKSYYMKFLIYPDNRRLQLFHLVVSLVLFYDFFLTGLLLGNYRFLIGQEPEFMDHKVHYRMICIVQISDIVLNFFKIEVGQRRKVNPYRIFLNYVSGNLVPDVVAVLPYSILYPPFIFLRYLKLLKFNTYLMYIEDFTIEIFNNFISNEQSKQLISIFRLLLQVLLVSYFFACLWILIGLWLLVDREEGWIKRLFDEEIQEEDFISYLITAMYWVITTFTSVGYGDVLGTTSVEYLYVMLVEMVGICFFGYMIGTFQQLIVGLGNVDHFIVQQEALELWLMSLDKATLDRDLISSVYKCVNDCYSYKFKNDAMAILKTEFFRKLKPRLQRECLDRIFKNFYDKLMYPFENCDDGFKREVISKCEIRYYQNESLNTLEKDKVYEEWPMKPKLPELIKAGLKSEKVFFILQGQVHIMNKSGMFDYGVLDDGSYFGDISALLDEPNEYSYLCNPFADKPVQLLSIESDDFLSICEKYRYSKKSMMNKALKRKAMFDNYKKVTLICYMKAIQKKPQIITKKLLRTVDKNSIIRSIQVMKKFDTKNDLFSTLIQLQRLKRIKSGFAQQESIGHKLQRISQLEKELTYKEALKNEIQAVVAKKYVDQKLGKKIKDSMKKASLKNNDQPAKRVTFNKNPTKSLPRPDSQQSMAEKNSVKHSKKSLPALQESKQEGLPQDFVKQLQNLQMASQQDVQQNLKKQLQEPAKKNPMLEKLSSGSSKILNRLIKKEDGSNSPVGSLRSYKFGSEPDSQGQISGQQSIQQSAKSKGETPAKTHKKSAFSKAQNQKQTSWIEEAKSIDKSPPNRPSLFSQFKLEPKDQDELKQSTAIQKDDPKLNDFKIQFRPPLLSQDNSIEDTGAEPIKKPKRELQVSSNVAQIFQPAEERKEDPINQPDQEVEIIQQNYKKKLNQNSGLISHESKQSKDTILKNSQETTQKTKITDVNKLSDQISRTQEAPRGREAPVRRQTAAHPGQERTFVFMTRNQIKAMSQSRTNNKVGKSQPTQVKSIIKTNQQTPNIDSRTERNQQQYEGGSSSSSTSEIQINMKSFPIIKNSELSLKAPSLLDPKIEAIKNQQSITKRNSISQEGKNKLAIKRLLLKNTRSNSMCATNMNMMLVKKVKTQKKISGEDIQEVLQDKIQNQNDVDAAISKMKAQLEQQLQKYFADIKVNERLFQNDVSKEAHKAKSRYIQLIEKQDAYSDDYRHPDRQEILREPNRSSIEAKMRQQTERCNYMDLIIGEYLNLDHLINVRNCGNAGDNLKAHQRVKIPKSFVTMGQAKENLHMNRQDKDCKDADKVIEQLYNDQIDYYENLTRGEKLDTVVQANDKFKKSMKRQLNTNKTCEDLKREAIDQVHQRVQTLREETMKHVNRLEISLESKFKFAEKREQQLDKQRKEAIAKKGIFSLEIKKDSVRSKSSSKSSKASNSRKRFGSSKPNNQMSKFYHQMRNQQMSDKS